MTCAYFRALLDDLVDRELSPSVETTVRKHLEVCEDCRAEHEELTRLRGLLAGLTVPGPAEGYWEESAELICARTVEAGDLVNLADLNQQRSRERVAFYRSLIAVAASLIVFFGSLLIGSSESFGGGKHSKSPAADKSMAAVEQAETRVSRSNYISADEQELIVGSMLLVGTPGMLAGSSGLAIAIGADGTR